MDALDAPGIAVLPARPVAAVLPARAVAAGAAGAEPGGPTAAGPRVPTDEPAPLAALRILADAVAAGHRDPFDPAVPLILAAGPLAGSGAPGTARVAAIGLSPLSGTVGETRAEGPFGAALRAAGASLLVLTGRAARPSILLLHNGSAELRDAAELADAGTVAATDALRSRYGARAGIAVIGPAGWRRARAATILTDRYFPLPRLGFGAILGDRNLAAIVCLPGPPAPAPGAVAPAQYPATPAPVAPAQDPATPASEPATLAPGAVTPAQDPAAAAPGGAAPVAADPAALAAIAARYRAEQPANPLTAWQHEPPGFGVWPYGAEPGYGAHRNFADTATAAGDGLAPDRFLARYRQAAPCPDCPTDCLKVFTPPAGPPVALHQEAVAALGPNLGVEDAGTVLAAVAACLDAGLDPVSVGGTLGCLYEAAERGRLPAGWPPCGFGTDPGPFVAAAARGADEFAAALRGGAARLAARLGVPDAAMTVRGVELPPFDPRIQPGLALAYAAAPTGPRYDAVEHDLDFDPGHGAPHCWPQLRELGLTAPEPAHRLDAARADRTAVLLALWSALDAYGICPYASTPTRPLSLALIGDLVAAGTGYRPDTAALLELGAERLRRQHWINAALGVAEPDRLPYRMHAEPVAAGAHAGAVLDPDRFAAAVARLRTRLGLA
ncbi:aldehyde ferredoxin oxidoreductase N-terminal domain-containing protein [Actinocatenispora comari]|uniref:aldehyde ferredoxin oxidoreductase N-terminal domain-containing protein n=1 Tax=Actinocatenispora comari TaxID=2807577 RepID=UPI001A9171D4|nr:aldehyde ferredoxin oxidoreductase N-terminal domain-containing protein [Actinocatenispora comari]